MAILQDLIRRATTSEFDARKQENVDKLDGELLTRLEIAHRTPEIQGATVAHVLDLAPMLPGSEEELDLGELTADGAVRWDPKRVVFITNNGEKQNLAEYLWFRAMPHLYRNVVISAGTKIVATREALLEAEKKVSALSSNSDVGGATNDDATQKESANSPLT